MGAYTEADRHLDGALTDVRSAIKHLGSIIIDECWGADHLTHEYREELQEALGLLIQVRKTIDPNTP
jgi:hypothetical protein